MPFEDLSLNAVQIMNKYFIIPVESLNMSVLNLDTNVNNLNTTVNNFNTSITVFNTSISSFNSSITSFNSSITNLNASIVTINTSLRNAIDSVNSTTLTIGGTNGTSTQSYAGALTSGTLSIGNSITTGNINIGSANASNQVNIGGVLVGANAINAGTNETNLQIASTNTSGSITIGSAQTSGVLNIGTGGATPGIRTATGNVNIANQVGNLCGINIMNGDGATTGGSVNIANGTLQTTTVNIASGTGIGTVTIGNLSNTTTINSGIINIARPPTMTYTTLPTFTSSQIGYTIRAVITTNTNVGTTGTFLNPFSATTFTLGVGVWSMQYQIRLRSATSTTVTGTAGSCNLVTQQNSITNYGLNWFTGSVSVGTASNYSFSGSAIISNSTAGNVLNPAVAIAYSPASSCQYAGGDCYFSVTRIA